MNTTIRKIAKVTSKENVVLLFHNSIDKPIDILTGSEQDYVKSKQLNGIQLVAVNQYTRMVYIIVVEDQKKEYISKDIYRRKGNDLVKTLDDEGLSALSVQDFTGNKEFVAAFCEGFLLGNYKFDKYQKQKKNYRKELAVCCDSLSEKDIEELTITCSATMICRDLVNEPPCVLTAPVFSSIMEQFSEEVGINCQVLHKKQIESLKMGGLLAVNKGSVDPPTFNILEWKPNNAKNSSPIVLVGKGIVYDTGGLSLKPTAGSMDLMKSDMGGAATVFSVIYAVAKAKLPVHLVTLIPATDNRPGGNAYAPGDVIKTMDGTTVEVKNTDAEGRIVMADALTYAKKYTPELVIDVATLTGAAVKTVGTTAIVSMGNAEEEHRSLEQSGLRTYERLAPMPFWDEFEEMVKSEIADISNVGGANAGAITAGKFLEHFTKENGELAYPWLHLDIAGPAFILKDEGYRKSGGTGFGVRVLFDFIKNK